MSSLKYRVGIDVGTHSIGFAAIEIDEHGIPKDILSAMSLIHDSGIDPDQNKQAITRLATSGVARRTRRLYRRRRHRMIRLEKFLSGLGWPINRFEDYKDPFLPWKVRAELAGDFIENEAERNEKLSVAVRHIANHRGWRNPYSKVQTLYSPGPPSQNFEEIRAELSKQTGTSIPDNITVGQLIAFANLGFDRIRGGGKAKDKKRPASEVKQAVISSRLQQSDHAREINKICAVQHIDESTRRAIIDHVFAAESPKGAQIGRVGKDPLQPGKFRALKASNAFQRYRISALISNLRIREGESKRKLSIGERQLVFDYLVNLDAKKEPTWLAVSEILSIDRGQLLGTATITNDGERAGARPPVHETNRAILSSKVKPLAAWWKQADLEQKDAMLKSLSNAEVDDWDSKAGASVQAFFADLDETDHEKLDSLHLPIGRAAYSEETLQLLTARMQSDGLDLYEALQAEFNIPSNWEPPAPAINEIVGNPAVDRVLKGVARYLKAAEAEWGAPESVVIEHVREGFKSASSVREINQDIERRTKRNLELYSHMQEKLGIEGKVRPAQLWRYQSIQRQNCQCAYCGNPIDFKNCEMDHIVPQAGPGSTNTRDNLVAVCGRCNRSKKNTPFATWAKQSTIPGVSLEEAIERTRHWNEDSGLTTKQFKEFVKKVVERLNRTSLDEPIDNRSLESVAWMANELRSRIKQHFSDSETKVSVYRGAITFEARQAAGITKKLRFLDGTGKTRVDRRHHAVDAAVVSLMRPFVAETLAVRSNRRRADQFTTHANQWQEYTGKDAAHRQAWQRWVTEMQVLANLLQKALDNDEIVVTSNIRLRVGNGRAHKETIGKLQTAKVGSAFELKQIDRAASEALWCALTRDPDFDPKTGLPENPNRKIKIHGTWYQADDTIEFFPVDAGAIKVRGGYAELSRFHHARIYKFRSGKKWVYSMLRVYNVDLVRHRNEDLFSVELKPQTMSMRQAEPRLRKALANSDAEYLGWLVVDDELEFDASSESIPQVDSLEEKFGKVTRWKVAGFYDKARIRLRPLQISGEGISKEDKLLHPITAGKG